MDIRTLHKGWQNARSRMRNYASLRLARYSRQVSFAVTSYETIAFTATYFKEEKKHGNDIKMVWAGL